MSTRAGAAIIVVLCGGCADSKPATPPAGPAVSAAAPASSPEMPPGMPPGTPAETPAGPWFTEVTDTVGIDVTHDAGADGGYRFEEIVSPGVAWLDYDGDGLLDLYLVNSGTMHRPGGDRSGRDRLLRQTADGSFEDATERSGIRADGYGVGCAAADYDNDGDVDLYVTNYGSNQLWRNEGDGTFTDVTADAGLGNELWSSSASFLDYDRDGLLDLVVVNYVLDPNASGCYDAGGKPEYCGPASFRPSSDKLYHNEGDGTFADVSTKSGIAGGQGPGLGVVCADFDDDGWPDIYVANDGAANFLWRNNGDGTFTESALVLGCAFNRDGAAEAGMGVTVGDVDDDGRMDLFVTHLVNETNTLYRGATHGTFLDGTDRSGLGMTSMGYTGFGVGFADLDHDADLDLLIANGAVKRRAAEADDVAASDYWRLYAEPNLLYVNDGSGRFHDASASAGPMCTRAEVSRGLAFADMDRDGDLDVVMTHDDGPTRLFRNDTPKQGRWLIVRACEPDLGGRDALGALVTVEAGGRRLVRPVLAGWSYASSNEPIAHFGLGDVTAIERVTIRWPDGVVEHFEGVPIDTAVTLCRGSGAVGP